MSSVVTFAVLRCVMISVLAALADARVLNIGVLYSSNSIYGVSQKTLVAMAEQWENTWGMKATLGIEYNIISYDVQSNATLVSMGTQYLMNVTNASVLVAPEGNLTSMVATLAQPRGVLVLAGMTGDDSLFQSPVGVRTFTNLIGTMTPRLHLRYRRTGSAGGSFVGR